MYISRISIKGRYGWRTVSLANFMRAYNISQRQQIISDPDRTSSINEFGEVIGTGEAIGLLEKLEAYWCTSATDLAKFLQCYPESTHRDVVENKLHDVLKNMSL